MTKKVYPVQQFNQQDIELLSTERVYQGFFRLDKLTFRHRLHDGGWSGEVKREIYQRSDAVAVLALDVRRCEVVLIEQLRIGGTSSQHGPWLLECIAGMIEPGEQAEDVCRREAMEEAGLSIGRLHKALSYLSSPGGTTERLHIYIGEADLSHAGGVHGLDEENEDILVHRVPLDTAFEWLESGRIDNASTVIALQWLALNQQQIFANWCD